MMEQISRVLLPGGIVVFNSVSENSYRLFLEAVEATPLTLQNECLVALDDNNPIRILSAVL
jgi:precorrin-6Y C5,15-methyltransferase (decarboxylating)